MTTKFEYPKGTATVDLQSYMNLQLSHEAFFKEIQEKHKQEKEILNCIVAAAINTIKEFDHAESNRFRTLIGKYLTMFGYKIEANLDGATHYLGDGAKTIILYLK